MPTGQVKQKYAICTPDGNFLSFAKKGEARGRLRSRAAKPSTHQADPAGGNQEWTARISNDSTETDDSAERKENSGKPGNDEEAWARGSAIGISSDLLFRSPSSARFSDPVSKEGSAMSANLSKITVPEIQRFKTVGQKTTALTAYDYPFARILDACGIDVLLVGDSLDTVVQGVKTTLPVTMDEMIYHLRLVSRTRPRALVVKDMPFLSYQASI